ncbi:MAG: hypothetical protein WKF47_08220 [Geodermatophilaceae bacterium]
MMTLPGPIRRHRAAQDQAGYVCYLGEHTQNYENGQSTEGLDPAGA